MSEQILIQCLLKQPGNKLVTRAIDGLPLQTSYEVVAGIVYHLAAQTDVDPRIFLQGVTIEVNREKAADPIPSAIIVPGPA